MISFELTSLNVPAIKQALNQWINQGKEIVIRDKQDIRSVRQNDCLHAKLTDISKQVEHCGKKLDPVTWKRLTTAAFLRELGEQPQMIPAIDGNGFDVIFERTSKMSLSMMHDYIEWVTAYGVEKGVRWTAPAWMMEYNWREDK